MSQLAALVEEAREIHPSSLPEERRVDSEGDLWAAIHSLPDSDGRAALCLSGGGIRSATFALGILQGLARQGVLERFHYLSTVSGGGYAGSWLSAWIAREGERHTQNARAAVLKQLCREGSEAAPIKKLRGRSRYLAPTAGLSGDALALLGGVGRNLVLNWLVLVPVLLATVLVPHLYLTIFNASAHAAPAGDRPGAAGLLWAGMAGLAAIIGVRSAWRAVDDDARAGSFGPLAIWAAAILLPLAWHAPRDHSLWVESLIFGTVVSVIGLLLGSRRTTTRLVMIRLGIAIAAGAGAGIALGTLSWLFDHAHAYLRDTTPGVRNALAVTGFPALLLTVHWFGTVVGIVLARKQTEEVRERWAYSTAKTFAFLLGWTVATSYVLLAPVLVLEAGGRVVIALSAAGGVSALLTALAGLWGRGGIERPAGQNARWWGVLQRNLLPVSAALFLAVLFLGLSALAPYLPVAVRETASLVAALRHAPVQGSPPDVASTATPAPTKPVPTQSDIADRYCRQVHAAEELTKQIDGCVITAPTTDGGVAMDVAQSEYAAEAQRAIREAMREAPSKLSESLTKMASRYRLALESAAWRQTATAMVLLLAFSSAVSLWVRINRFSLHHVYGNRLIGAYLGASNEEEPSGDLIRPNDDRSMASVSARSAGTVRLFHVLNLTLNATKGLDGGEQDRKANGFTVTRLRCGSTRTGFYPTGQYTGSGGISLGRAMAISGAAVSPGMGYHSSTLVACVMTLFNTRLGWWLPNPGSPAVAETDGPRWGLGWLVRGELLGSMHPDAEYLYVSDGGHFDNLGLYEMIRRRCRRVIVVDASQDNELEYDDLARVIRLVRSDFGVEIDLRVPFAPEVPPTIRRRPHMIGRIVYPERDGDGEPQEGWLLYLKPWLIGNEPIDVQRYARARRALGGHFPHDATSDQFFDEAQFESYRRLGCCTADDLKLRVRQLFSAPDELHDAWRSASRAPWGPKADEATPPAQNDPVAVAPAAESSWARLLQVGSSWFAPAIATGVIAATVTVTTVRPRESAINLSPITNQVQQDVGKMKTDLSTTIITAQIESAKSLQEVKNEIAAKIDEQNKGAAPFPPMGPLPMNMWDEIDEWRRASERLQLALAELLKPDSGSSGSQSPKSDQTISLLKRIAKQVETMTTSLQNLDATVHSIDPRRVVPGEEGQ